MSDPLTQLAALPPELSWARRATTAFPVPADAVAVLPIYGLADHRLGLSWDVEELVGSVLLTESSREAKGGAKLQLLPPLRLSLAPYHPTLTGTDPETLHATLRILAKGLKHAGITRLAIWSTHPWNTELLEAAICDLRVEHGLETWLITLEAIGLSLHPRMDEGRAHFRALACHLTGSTPGSFINDGTPHATAFRPGNWRHYPPVPDITNGDPEHIRRKAAERLARHWEEIIGNARGPNLESIPFPEVYPAEHRAHYLPALSPAETELWAKTEPIVLLPLGAIEQHGPHLPVGVDSMIGEAAALGLAQRCGQRICCGPTLAYGKSNEHADFPGTLDIGGRILRRLLRATIGNIHALGFTKFAVLNTHGGNSAMLLYTLRELQAELDVTAVMLRLPGSGEQSPIETQWGFHAGEWETSVMLAIAPELVDMTKASSHYPTQAEHDGACFQPGGAPALFGWSTRDLSESGVLGDATRATAAKGERWFEAALDTLAEQIEQL